jgi:hypothetical protein
MSRSACGNHPASTPFTGGARSKLPLDDLTSTFARVDVDDEPGRGALGPACADTGRVVVPSIALGPLAVRDLVVDLAPEARGSSRADGPAADDNAMRH